MENYPNELNNRIELERNVYNLHYVKTNKVIKPFYYHNRKYEEKFVKAIIKKYKIKEKSKILDLGCGNSLYSDIFFNNNMVVTGIDLSETSIEHCKNMYSEKINFLCQDAFSLNSQGAYDMVFCSFFTYFNAFDKPLDANVYVERMMSYLKTGGHLFFIWISDLTSIRLPPERFSIMNYTIKQLESMFQKYEKHSYAIDSLSRLTYYFSDKAFNKYITKLSCAIVQFLDSSWRRVRIIIVVKK